MYQVSIIGGGVAGLTAGIYAKRYGLDTVLFESKMAGGLVTITDIIENYPGFPEGINSFQLIENFKKQAEKFGLPIKYEMINKIEKKDNVFYLYTHNKKYETEFLILATGSTPRKLGLNDEDKFIGKGISFCATCDGFLYKDRVVAVVGGGDTAIIEALFLSRLASKVYLIHRRDQLRANKPLQEKMFKNEKISFLSSRIITKLVGKEFLEKIIIKNLKEEKEEELSVDGLFIFIGYNPNTSLVSELISLDDKGYIITNEEMETEVENLYAAGDCRKKPLYQIVTACADGAIAAYSIARKVENK